MIKDSDLEVLIFGKVNGGYEFIADCVGSISKSLLNAEIVTTSKILFRIKNKLYRRINFTAPLVRFIAKISSVLYLRSKKNQLIYIFVCGADLGAIPLIYGSSKTRITIYVWDSWPKERVLLSKVACALRIDEIIFSSSMALNMFKRESRYIPKTLRYLPEAVSDEKFKIHDKDNDFIYFGARLPKIHRALLTARSEYNLGYLYSSSDQNVLDLSLCLPRSIAGICLTSELTRPQRSEGISTITQRYLECCISKVMIFGETPEESVSFPFYIHVIPIPLCVTESELSSFFFEEIVRIKTGFYDNEIRCNYENVLKYATWNVRALQLLGM